MATKRPYVICHMLPSIDGRIVIRGWKLPNATAEYERTAATFDADAWIIGRISMEPYAGKARFGIRKLLLEGGGKINGSFLAANLIDELSILVGPIADGSTGTATLFDVENRRMPARNLKLLSMEKRSGGIVWLRYKVRR